MTVPTKGSVITGFSTLLAGFWRLAGVPSHYFPLVVSFRLPFAVQALPLFWQVRTSQLTAISLSKKERRKIFFLWLNLRFLAGEGSFIVLLNLGGFIVTYFECVKCLGVILFIILPPLTILLKVLDWLIGVCFFCFPRLVKSVSKSSCFHQRSSSYSPRSESGVFL